MKGHLVLLSGQLDSGTLGSVPVTKTFFAGNKPRSNNNNNYTYYIDEHGIWATVQFGDVYNYKNNEYNINKFNNNNKIINNYN